MSQFVWTFLGGKIIDNWATIAATTGNPHVDKDVTVPSGKRWFFIAASMSHDDSVTHVMNIDLYNENDKLLGRLNSGDTGGAGARPIIHAPVGVANTITELGFDSLTGVPMKTGWYIRFSAGTNMTDASVAWEYTCIILEIDAP